MLVSAIALIGIGACAHHPRASSTEGGEDASVTGTVADRERIALPADAVAEISFASTDLAGTSWVLEDLNGAGIGEGTHVTLDFSVKGRATGNGSCNKYFATVDISGSSIRVGAVGSTRMACATAVSLQEVKYFEALEAAHRFVIEGASLCIYGGSNKPLRFTRATP